MAWRVLPVVLGSCLLLFSYVEENRSHTGLHMAKPVPISSTGPEAMHEVEVEVFGLEQKYKSPDIILMNHNLRLPRHAEKKKRKHNAGAFSPLSMPSDGKKTHNSRTKRQDKSKGKKRLLMHHEQTSTEKPKVPQKKPVKKPKPPGVFSVLSYTSQNKERFDGQIEDLDD